MVTLSSALSFLLGRRNRRFSITFPHCHPVFCALSLSCSAPLFGRVKNISTFFAASTFCSIPAFASWLADNLRLNLAVSCRFKPAATPYGAAGSGGAWHHLRFSTLMPFAATSAGYFGTCPRRYFFLYLRRFSVFIDKSVLTPCIGGVLDKQRYQNIRCSTSATAAAAASGPMQYPRFCFSSSKLCINTQSHCFG